jgi:molybdate transport system permease protein
MMSAMGGTTSVAPRPRPASGVLGSGLARVVLGVVFFAAIAVALAFMVLPVVAIFTHVPPGDLIDQLSSPVVHDGLIVSLRTSLVAQALILAFGTPTAYFLATRRFRGRAIVVTLVELPIVLPPAVAGIGLLVTFGRFGQLGKHYGIWEWTSFNWLAVTFAVMLVAGPFYVRQAIAAFEAVDQNLVAASRTLGAGPVRTFFRVTLPLAAGGLLAGEAISLARGLGEFGATIMFAGSLQGTTQTLTLAVYGQFEVSFDRALAISALLVVISLAILLTLKLSGLWGRTRPAVVAVAGRDVDE